MELSKQYSHSNTVFLLTSIVFSLFAEQSSPVSCTFLLTSINTEETVSQIWAETLNIYKRGEVLYLRGDEVDEAVQEQAAAMESDDREGIVRNYLDALLPVEWDEMSLYERRNFLTGSEFGGETHKGTVRRETVSNIEIWCECFQKDAAAIKPVDSYAIAAVMKKIDGWDKDGDNGRATLPIYGRQRLYRRTKS